MKTSLKTSLLFVPYLFLFVPRALVAAVVYFGLTARNPYLREWLNR